MKRLNYKKLGEVGERTAEEFLKERGYVLIEKNHKNRYGEIDLILEKDKGKKIVFVEVKTRYESNISTPEDAINKKKIKRIIKNAESYILFNNIDKEVLIEAVCIIFDKGNNIKEIRHYEDIL